MNRYVFSYLDLLPFIVMVILLLLTLHCKTEIKKKTFYSFMILFLFAAFRYGIGYDYFEYKEVVLRNINGYERFEPLSRVLADIAYHSHYQVFFALGSFLTLFPVYYVCRKVSINPAFSLILFFLHPDLYLNGLGIVRNAISFSLVLFAIYLLTNKKIILSIAFVFIAFLFHRSAAIAILIYPLFLLKNTRILHVSLYIISFFVSVIIKTYIGQYASDLGVLGGAAEHYLEVKAGEGGRTMTIIVNAICVFNLLFWDKLSTLDKRNRYFLALINIGVCLWNAFLFLDSTMANRLNLYYEQLLIIIIPYYKYLVRPRLQPVARRASLLFFLLLFSSSFYINVKGYMKDPLTRMSCVPYQVFFLHEDYSNYYVTD